MTHASQLNHCSLANWPHQVYQELCSELIIKSNKKYGQKMRITLSLRYTFYMQTKDARKSKSDELEDLEKCVDFRITWKDWFVGCHFSHDRTNAPNIDRRGVGLSAQQNL